eukprot:CAMPEP_0119067402 /NCGR_PEP_ID=MMETSP1178-20130426/9767_1 /TAXON_ID=33656 /ORGANISM="unid sp, Strain CCMP2000" /LENGTH=127 /DNA_ID=CAMNT_0007049055 /DNA_START=45 /DNA_END=426 /DNA_ORIENTATION=-
MAPLSVQGLECSEPSTSVADVTPDGYRVLHKLRELGERPDKSSGAVGLAGVAKTELRPDEAYLGLFGEVNLKGYVVQVEVDLAVESQKGSSKPIDVLGEIVEPPVDREDRRACHHLVAIRGDQDQLH